MAGGGWGEGVTMDECFECQGPALVSHHVVPLSRGGKKTVRLCGKCHGLAHHCNRNMETSTITKAALAAKRSKGERTGEVPFGWQCDNGRLVSVPSEQAVLLSVRQFRNAGLSLRAIAGILTAFHIPTKKGRTTWYASTIRSILSRAQ